nr:DUF2723 domain-containing protein [Calditrichia bacterium]
MEQKQLTRIFGTLTFAISMVAYWMTMAPTVSFWDCGEFIACAYKMAIPHPPGAPIYLLIGRIFTFLPDFLFGNVAAKVNFISVLASAFTVLFLYLIVVQLVKEMIRDTEGVMGWVPHLGGFVGAMALAFSHSFWFNAVEAEVYALSMFFTSFMVWLVLKWADHQGENANSRWILAAAYVMGLAMGVHILNVLVLPALVLVVYFKRFEPDLKSFAIMGAIGLGLTALLYPGVVIYIPAIAKNLGFVGLIAMILALMALLYFFVDKKMGTGAIFVLSMLLIIVGYSAYLMILIRSGLDPNIDENNPETMTEFVSYINREQYGDHHLDREKRRMESPNGRAYQGKWDFFWDYQIQEMYVRYFMWNFAGIKDVDITFRDRVPADPFKFWMIPLLLGFFGAYMHFQRDWKNALMVFALFFMTGLAIVLYLNQPDPQPRERDYSYVGSFFAFAIWIGIGAAGVLEAVAGYAKRLGSGAPEKALTFSVALLMLVLVPMRMFSENYHLHNRKGNYVARDYSYNMLVSAGKNGVIFTNGDNDTFPLWYLQEVENVRPDVRVANLSLLNTSWYIQQLKDMKPTAPISLSDEQIDKISLIPWPNNKNFELPVVPEDVVRAEAQRFEVTMGEEANVPERMSFNLRPKYTYRSPDGRTIGMLRVQDLMILNILSTNRF